MSKQLQLSIPTPCHENWDNMTPVQHGKFCGSCQKQVVDFSTMSDRQVAEFFKKPSTGSVCGRFMSDQLDRSIEIPKKRIPWLKYFFQFAIPAFLVSIKASAEKTQGKIKMRTTAADTARVPFPDQLITMGTAVARPTCIKPAVKDTVVKPVKNPNDPIKGDIKVVGDTIITEPVCARATLGEVVMRPLPAIINTNILNGSVVDEKGEPVPFASIELGSAGQYFIADSDGKFTVKKSQLKKGDSLVVSSAGFESKTIIIGEENFAIGGLYVQLKANIVLPEIILKVPGYIVGRLIRVTVNKKVTKGELLVKRSDTVFTNSDKKIFPDEPQLLIYPNPVQSGAAIHLSFKKPEEGYYQLHIMDLSGQLILQKEIWIDREAGVLNIDVPEVAAGSYFLTLTNKNSGKRVTEKIIIQ